MGKLKIEQRVIGMVATNVYLGINTETKEAFLVDPADHAGDIAKWIQNADVTLKAILLTHGHFDHIGAASALQTQYSIPVCAMQEEQEILLDAQKNLSGLYGRPITVKADRFFKDGETLHLAGFSFTALHTPGHTVGGCCYYCAEEQVLFSGDTLFHGSVGRTDFPTGSMGMLHDSIHRKLFPLPAETIVYPGHGEATDIAYEKRYNPY